MPYSGDPSSSTRDALRFQLGDTAAAALLSDAEYDYLLTQAGGALEAALVPGCEAILAKLAQSAYDYTAGRTSAQLSKQVEHYRALLSVLRSQVALIACPVSTGQDRAADQVDGENQALKQPQFALEQMDNPEAGSPRAQPLEGDEFP